MAVKEIFGADSRRPFRILGACWLAYGVIECVTGIWLLFVQSTATLMFGALLNRVPDPFTLMDLFHLFYGAAIVVTVIGGVLGVLAGWALLAGAQSARSVVLIAAFLSLAHIPLGLTLGIVTLIMVLPLTQGDANARLDERGAHLENRSSWEGTSDAR
jgi:hypothetical protein